MAYVLCRRNLADLGAPDKFCCQPIKQPNALNWCDACRARLPLWPANDGPVAHVGRGIAEAFGLDKLPPGLVVIHEDPVAVILPPPKAPPRCLPHLADIQLPEDIIDTTAENVADAGIDAVADATHAGQFGLFVEEAN